MGGAIVDAESGQLILFTAHYVCIRYFKQVVYFKQVFLFEDHFLCLQYCTAILNSNIL